MKKVLFVVAPKDFRDEEYLEPKEVLEREGIKVITASIKGKVAVGADGTRAKIDLLIDRVNPEDYNGVVFIGGHGMIILKSDKRLVDLAKKFFQAEKLICAICVAPTVLANAGLLKNVEATVYPNYKEELEAKGARASEDNVVVSKMIITGKGPFAAREFGEAILHKLKIKN